MPGVSGQKVNFPEDINNVQTQPSNSSLDINPENFERSIEQNCNSSDRDNNNANNGTVLAREEFRRSGNHSIDSVSSGIVYVVENLYTVMIISW